MADNVEGRTDPLASGLFGNALESPYNVFHPEQMAVMVVVVVGGLVGLHGFPESSSSIVGIAKVRASRKVKTGTDRTTSSSKEEEEMEEEKVVLVEEGME